MDLDLFIVAVFCLVDKHFDKLLAEHGKLRSRGPKPLLDDREVLTMEIVGEFLGMDTDKRIHEYFARHWAHFFPVVATVRRTTFCRQAANLWAFKERLSAQMLEEVERDPRISIVDSFAVPVSSFAKAPRHRSFRGVASIGYDSMAQAFLLGFRAHLRVAWPGVIVSASLAPANEHDRWVVEDDLLDGFGEGWLVGDTNYHSPTLAGELADCDIDLVAPKKTSKKREEHPWPRWLTNLRRRIETVASQLVERYRIKRVWARDLWHLTSRFWRKILSHTCCVVLCQREGLSPLRFSELFVR